MLKILIRAFHLPLRASFQQLLREGRRLCLRAYGPFPGVEGICSWALSSCAHAVGCIYARGCWVKFIGLRNVVFACSLDFTCLFYTGNQSNSCLILAR